MAAAMTQIAEGLRSRRGHASVAAGADSSFRVRAVCLKRGHDSSMWTALVTRLVWTCHANGSVRRSRTSRPWHERQRGDRRPTRSGGPCSCRCVSSLTVPRNATNASRNALLSRPVYRVWRGGCKCLQVNRRNATAGLRPTNRRGWCIRGGPSFRLM